MKSILRLMLVCLFMETIFSAGLFAEEGSTVPEWVRNTTIKGDLRLRFQYEDAGHERWRERIRYRIGFQTEINDWFCVGARLASGGSDPRSTNQTLDDVFSTKAINLDQAYVIWKPINGLKVYAGKFTNKVIWKKDDLLIDTDINFEGQALMYTCEMNDSLDLFAHAGLFILDEFKSSNDDPLMYYVQGGIDWGIVDNIDATLAVAYFGFTHVKDSMFEYSAGGNSLEQIGIDPDTGDPIMGLMYDYNSINVAGQVAYVWDDSNDIPWAVAFIGDFIYNTDSEETGYLVGLKGGHKKVKAPGSWQVMVSWRRLEADAWMDTFPDSDFYGGATDVEGFEIKGKYAVAKYVTIDIDYYHAEQIDGDGEEDLAQLDLVLKF